jgi:hypothetical protein
MPRKDTLVRKLQSAIAYVETVQELHRSEEAPLEIIQALQAVVAMLQEIRREVLLQELTRILHNEHLSEAARKEKVGKIFQSLA